MVVVRAMGRDSAEKPPRSSDVTILFVESEEDDGLRSSPIVDSIDQGDSIEQGDSITTVTATQSAAIQRVREGTVDCAVVRPLSESIDDRIGLLQELRDIDPDLPIVLFGAGDERDPGPAEAIEVGATDYVQTPLEGSRQSLVERRLWNYARRYRAERTAAEFRTIFEALPDAAVVHDDEGTYHRVNQAACELLGYDREQLLEKNVGEIEIGSDDETLEAFWNACDPGESLTVEGRNRRKDGTEFPVRVSLRRIDRNGHTRFVVSVRDITVLREREQELERSLDFLRRTEEIAEAGGWELDVTTGALRWTDGTRRIHEVDAAYDPTLSTAIEFYHPEDRARVRSAIDGAIESGEPFDETLRLTTAEDTQRWVRVRGHPHRTDGKTVQVRGVIVDVTDIKEQKRRLEAYTEQLEVFHRILRHDLRNQMNVIVGCAKSLEDQVDDDGAAFVEQIRDAGSRILSISDEIREVRRLIDADYEPHPVRVATLVETALESVREEYADFECVVSIPESLRVDATPGLRIAVENVLENAIEHNDTARPRVQISADAESGGEEVTIRIRDNGPGIPRRELELLTGQRERSPVEHTSGVGLWAVHWIVDVHGGALAFDTDSTDGTTVTLRLPGCEQSEMTGKRSKH